MEEGARAMTDRLDHTRPVARQKDLVVEHLDDEILIYDLETDRAHCLNATAALVWKNCDGHKSVSELGELLERQVSSPAGTELVWLALHELSKKKLLNEIHDASPAPLSRRALVRGLGVALAALPLITSIISPTPAEAATCLSSGQPCATSAECCSGLCNVPPGPGTCA